MKGVTIDDAAATFRRRLAPKTQADEPVDMLQALEDFDGKEIPLKRGGAAVVKYGIETLPSHVLARTMLLRKEGHIVVAISEHTHRALEKSDEGWARFTVPHEFGHVRLHLKELADLIELPHEQIALARANPSHRVYEDSEWQADRFAAAFMAPCAGLRYLQRNGRLNENDVMSTYGMARTMARIRIENFLNAERERKSNKGGR